MQPTAAILTHGWLSTVNAKTAHGLVRGPSRYRILGVVDHAHAGRDAGEVLDGERRGIPIYADLDALLAGPAGRPDWCVIGIATPGGVLPPEFRALLLQAIERGMGLVNGLHRLLGDDPEFAAAAARRGVEMVDVRRPKPRAELAFWSGAVRQVRAPRIAVLGTDCALGKRTTCQLLAQACREGGLRAEVIYTGQTGWLQGLRYGFVLDTTPNDFVCGELEAAIVACDREAAPDVMLLEGQSALRNPSGPCGAELLLAGEARAVVLQHAPARRYFEAQEELGNEIPPLADELQLLRHYRARVLALALNHQGLAPEERAAVRDRLVRSAGVPAVYPLLDGVGELVPVVREVVERARR
jgi:uncharacterized NAD-dependent epimerase/dehydratase family protein